jgi:hypothetical protein
VKNDIVIRSTGTDHYRADNDAIKQIVNIGREYNATDHSDERMRFHVVLHNQSLVDTLRSTSLVGWLKDNIEIYAYSFSDLSAISLLGVLPGAANHLDFKPIKFSSDHTIHLVLLGSNSYTESLAMYSALIAHYPNYSRDNTLRTRITMVSECIHDFDNFRRRNKNLLTHSYTREVKIINKDVNATTFAPKYAYTRRDFIDVEWEFVEAPLSNDILNYKFEKWANDETQLTSFAFCDDDKNANLANAIALSATAKSPNYQIFIKAGNFEALNLLHQLGRYTNIIAFDDISANFNDFAAIIRMAQLVNYAYDNMHDSSDEAISNGQTLMEVVTETPSDEQIKRAWNKNDNDGNPKLNTQKRWSNIYAAFTIPAKLRSIGLDADKYLDLYVISNKDINLLSEVEHNRWNVEELILGFQPTTDEEDTEILKDIDKRKYFKRLGHHNNIRNFNDLGIDESGKSVVRYDVAIVRSIPLIAYSYNLRNNK